MKKVIINNEIIYICECGDIIKDNNLKKHHTTHKHQTYINDSIKMFNHK